MSNELFAHGAEFVNERIFGQVQCKLNVFVS